MTKPRIRFTISHLLEVITALAIALALGKAIPPWQESGVRSPAFLLIVAGGAVGTFLGVRLFRREALLRCFVKTMPLAMLTTGVSLLPYYSLVIARYGSIFSRRMMTECAFAFVPCLMGGIIGATLAVAIIDIWRSSALARK